MYLRLLEEYSTYMTKANKRKTLVLLYELLMHPDGDVRRIAGRIMGKILANAGRATARSGRFLRRTARCRPP